MNMKEFLNFINGEYVKNASGKTFENRNPVDNSLIGKIYEAGRPEVITAETTWSRSRVVEWAYRGICTVASQNVPLSQPGSRQNQRRLAHTTSTAPATGTSRTFWDRREWTLVASTPQDGQPGGSMDSITTRRPPSGRSIASVTR